MSQISEMEYSDDAAYDREVPFVVESTFIIAQDNARFHESYDQ